MHRLARLFLSTWLALTGLLVASGSLAYNIDTSNTSPTNVTGLWWNPNESGWGAMLTGESNLIFVAMYTYNTFGAPVWYVVPIARLSEVVASARCTGCRGHGPHPRLEQRGRKRVASGIVVDVVFRREQWSDDFHDRRRFRFEGDHAADFRGVVITAARESEHREKPEARGWCVEHDTRSFQRSLTLFVLRLSIRPVPRARVLRPGHGPVQRTAWLEAMTRRLAVGWSSIPT